MITRLKILMITLTWSLVCCSHCSKEPVREVQLQQEVNDRLETCISIKEQPCSVNLVELFEPVLWDSILVIRPYTPDRELSKLSLANKWQVMASMQEVAHIERGIGLYFIRDNTITTYTLLDGSVPFRFRNASTATPFIRKSLPYASLVRSLTPGNETYFYLEYVGSGSNSAD